MKQNIILFSFFTLSALFFLSPLEDWFLPWSECIAPSNDDMDFYYDVTKLEGSPFREVPECLPDKNLELN